MPWSSRKRETAGCGEAGATRGIIDHQGISASQERSYAISYDSAPVSVRSLEQRIRNLEGSEGLALRRRVSMALVVVGQMLPEGAVKGGSAMALRYGRGTRFTRDLDAARIQPLVEFRSDFEDSLKAG